MSSPEPDLEVSPAAKVCDSFTTGVKGDEPRRPPFSGGGVADFLPDRLVLICSRGISSLRKPPRVSPLMGLDGPALSEIEPGATRLTIGRSTSLSGSNNFVSFSSKS